MKHIYKIYQLDTHKDSVVKSYKLFVGWEWLNKHSVFDFTDYKEVWCDEIETGENISDEEILDILFQKFNLEHPKNYHGRSMSTSDIVELDGIRYYCDSFSWVKI